MFKAHRLLYHSILGLRVIKVTSMAKTLEPPPGSSDAKFPYLTESIYNVVLQKSIPA